MQRKLDIVSLGPGKIDQLTIEAHEVLLKSKKIYCRFINPLLNYFIHKYKKLVISFESFYSNPKLVQKVNRTKLYMKIAELIVNEALINERVVYALPGSAFIVEDTTYLIYKIAKAKGLAVNAILGVSFIDVLLSSLPEKYKEYLYPNLVISTPILHIIPFNGFYSYIIVQAQDVVKMYKPQMIEEILSKYYPKDFKFLYIYYKNKYKISSYNMKIIEFQTKDINKLIDIFERYNGSIFVPSQQISYEVQYKKLIDTTLKYKNKTQSFLADLKIEESLAFFNLKRYSEALNLAQNALVHTKRRGIHFLIGECLVKCNRYYEAIPELRKAEEENPESAEINHLLGVCYKNLGQIDKFWEEIEITLRKKKKI